MDCITPSSICMHPAFHNLVQEVKLSLLDKSFIALPNTVVIQQMCFFDIRAFGRGVHVCLLYPIVRPSCYCVLDIDLAAVQGCYCFISHDITTLCCSLLLMTELWSFQGTARLTHVTRVGQLSPLRAWKRGGAPSTPTQPSSQTTATVCCA